MKLNELLDELRDGTKVRSSGAIALDVIKLLSSNTPLKIKAHYLKGLIGDAYALEYYELHEELDIIHKELGMHVID